jgi:hypothetical protein
MGEYPSVYPKQQAIFWIQFWGEQHKQHTLLAGMYANQMDLEWLK